MERSKAPGLAELENALTLLSCTPQEVQSSTSGRRTPGQNIT